MATIEKVRLADPVSESEQARAIASRYRCEYVDLRETAIDHDLFRSIPVDLMFRYNFVPIQAQNGTLEIALSDPRNLNLIDELTLLLNKKLRVKVTTLSQISDLLKKTEQSQRVLEEVTEGFTLDVVGDEENQDETLSIDRLSAADSNIAVGRRQPVDRQSLVLVLFVANHVQREAFGHLFEHALGLFGLLQQIGDLGKRGNLDAQL